jgi:hypothetical protein
MKLKDLTFNALAGRMMFAVSTAFVKQGYRQEL